MSDKSTSKALFFVARLTLFFIIMLVCALALNLAYNALESRRRGASFTPCSADVKSILIDAGHGGADGGAVGISGSLEKDINLSVSLKLGALLDAVGYDVHYTRTEDIMLDGDVGSTPKVRDIRKRVAVANELDTLLVSIHMNSYPAEKYYGFQAFYAENGTDSDIIAKKLQDYIKSTVQTENTREPKPAPKTVFLTSNVTCPAVIVECGFISNANEEQMLLSEDYQCRLAAALCCAIAE